MGALAIGAFLLMLVAVYLIGRPLVVPEARAPESGDGELLVEKEQLLQAIRELDMDLAMGKLSDEDHRQLRARYLAQAAITVQAISESGETPPSEEPEEQSDAVESQDEGRAARSSVEDELESEIAARKAALGSRADVEGGEERERTTA